MAQSEAKEADELKGCRFVNDVYEKLEDIAEGSYGSVSRARNRLTGEIVALKKVKIDREREGAPITSIREVRLLLGLSHENIVALREIVIGGRNRENTFIVMDYIEHDLKNLMDHMKKRKQQFSIAEAKCLMFQLLSGLNYLHENWIFHRDLKTPNLLYNNSGVLKAFTLHTHTRTARYTMHCQPN
jgi:cell division cycle 2-like protein